MPTYAQEDVYVVMDANSDFVVEFDNYLEAHDIYMDEIDNYDNLVLIKNDKVIDMEYGIVEFNGIFEYRSIERNKNDYISSSYGIDGAYLYSDEDRVYFKVSQDVGYTDYKNVTLIPFELLNVSPSVYETKDDYLYHNIKTQLKYEYFSNSLCLDKLPEYVNDNSIYYSYDGHYFYDDFYSMIDDYRKGIYENSINSTPYYNYYEYLPHRSLSNYSLAELEDYFYNVLCIDGKMIGYIDKNNDGASDEVNKSQMFNELDEFYNCQNLYGVNEMMLISSAIVESSYGKDLNAYINNNLYVNAAYETENEKTNNRYNSISNSIYSHAKYFISSLYSNHLKDSYNGTYYGNKAGGINIEYSLDTYYGEKAASQYFKLDKVLGLKDYNSLAIVLINKNDELSIYKDAGLSDLLYSLNNVNELALVALQAGDNYYKIQIDDSFNSDYLYDFTDSVGYISKDDVSFILNEENIHEYELNKVNYDFAGGSYYDYSSLAVKSLSGYIDPSIEPKKAGFEFEGYTSSTNENGSLVYVANYKEISNISIDYLYEIQKELLPYPNLNHARLLVKYADGTSKKVHINSDMVTSYDLEDFDAQTINVAYCGLSIQKDIQIDGEYYLAYADLKDAINNKDAKYVKGNVDNVVYPYTMNDIRTLDIILKEENNRNYVIKDNTKKYNLSISGLDLSLDDRRNFNLIEDTYYVIIDNISFKNNEKLNTIANDYGFKVEDGLNISFKFNYQNIDLRGPAIVQLDIKDKATDRIYTVYHVDDNNNIIKCRTTQSNNFIQFVIEEKGDYLLLSLPSNNEYNIDDTIEDLSYANMGFDNNRINLEFMLGVSLIMLSLIGILIYYRIEENKERQWKDYKKLLQKADTVQEEKQKN